VVPAETELSMDVLAQTKSVFALANGHIGWRITNLRLPY
jgi:trehalose/maltose hydrolase-like predicted phosphorylase